MDYKQYYESPLGSILLTSDGNALTGLWFTHDQRFLPPAEAQQDALEQDLPVFTQTRTWLDAYFGRPGVDPGPIPPVEPHTTPFRQEVCAIMSLIPYGQLVTYGQIAQKLAEKHGKRMSAQAVGGAVGHNPISLIVPCHRVIGSGGNLTGYGGGMKRKVALLELEGHNMDQFTVPTKGTAL